jgi:putative ABC transport system substrate-binding protein
MKRREFITLLGGAVAAWPPAAHAQQAAARTRRIGLIASLPLRPIESFRRKLQALGYTEGKNLVVEYRFTEGRDDQYPAFAAELAALPVELIVTWGTPAVFAAKHATTNIPIVFVAGDAVNTGIVSNLAHPEGNVTGFVALNVELEEKRLELLKEIQPSLSRLAVLGNSLNPLNRINLETVRREAQKLSVGIDTFEVRNIHDVAPSLRRLIASRPEATLVAPDTLLLSERKQIADAMAQNKIPAIYPFREYAEVGGFIMYGANLSVLFQRAAEYTDRILNGERPGALPVQQATAFELVINLKAALGLGLTLPQIVLVRADEVIE